MLKNQLNITKIKVLKETLGLKKNDDYLLTQRLNGDKVDIWWNESGQLRGKTFSIKEYESFISDGTWVIVCNKN